MKNVMKICLAGFIVLFVLSCGSSYKENVDERNKVNAEKQRKEKAALKIATLPTLDCLPVWVAAENGFFNNIPDSFIVKDYNSQIDIEHALLKEQIEVGASDTKRLEKVNEKDTVLTSLGYTNLCWILIANKASRVNSPEKLGDKMVAMTRFSATDYLTDRVLADYPHPATTFKIQINDVNVRLQMLQNNAMDAMWLPEPYATAAKQMGHNQLIDSRKYDALLAVMAVRCADLKNSKRQKQLNVFVEGYNRACDSLNKNGWKQYEPLLIQHLNTTEQTLQKLPKFTFKRLNLPVNVQ